MRQSPRRHVAAVLPLLLSACAGAPSLPPETGPSPFVIERDLEGSTLARGQFSSITGVRRDFIARLEGVRSGETFTLKETFEYDDGEKDQKTWVLTLKGGGQYTGVREDVVGEARGWQDGSAFRLEYDIRLPGEDGKPGLQVRFRDVMVKTADGIIINNATVGKWGLNVGKVALKIKRP
jgi:Protein of unknown function (DUF3833)